MLLPVETPLNLDVDQRLGKQGEVGGLLGKCLAAALDCAQDLQGADRAVTCGVAIEAQQMTRSLSAIKPAALLQHLEHIAITDLGARKSEAHSGEGLLQTDVGHQRADRARNRALPHPVLDDEIEEFIAVVEAPLGIAHQKPVGIAIERDPEMGLAGQHRGLQGLRMGRADMVVDVQAVGRSAHLDDLCPEFVKHMRCRLIGGAMGAVDNQSEPSQIETRWEGPFAELDVTAGGIIDSPRFAERVGAHATHRLVEGGFDLQFHLVGQLVAIGRKKLDAVVIEGIVRGADHHARRQSQCTGEIGHRGCGQRPRQHHIDTGRRKSGLQCRLEHIARDAGVLADQHC